MCLFLGSYSYVTDHSSKEYRTLRITIVDFIFYIGISIGYGGNCPGFFLRLVVYFYQFLTAIAGKVYEGLGYIGVYCFGIVFQSSAIIYGVFVIKKDKVCHQSF